METGVVKATTFTGLGQALRWLRERQTRKQYQVADLAGITKGMLSAYETGRQRPSLETLDKLLDTLACDLNDLHNAIQIVNGRPEAIRRFAPPAARSPSAAPGAESYAGAGGGAGRVANGSFDQAYPFRRRSSAALGVPGESGAPDAPGTYGLPGGPCAPDPLDQLDQINQLDQTDQTDQTPQIDQIAEKPEASELYRVLGHSASLPDPEERALAQMLDGFHQLIRYWDQALERLRRARAPAPSSPSEPAKP